MSPRSTSLVAAARRASPLAVLTATLMLGACASSPNSGGDLLKLAQQDPKASPIATASAEKPQQRNELQKATEYWGKQHGDNPTDPRAAVNYARNLKAMGAKKEALVILQEAHRHNPTDREILSEYGRLALEHDQLSAAQTLLEKADDPVRPDWRVISARGTLLAKQGRHEESIAFFERARALAPDQGSILNNLAMAYAMNGNAAKAEAMLRDAQLKDPDDQRIAHNLAIVLGLQGKHGDVEKVAAPNGASETVAHNADVVRQIVGNVPQPSPALPAPATAPRVEPVVAKGTKTAPSTPAAVRPTAATTKARGKAKSEEPDATDSVYRLADGEPPKSP